MFKWMISESELTEKTVIRKLSEVDRYLYCYEVVNVLGLSHENPHKSGGGTG